jgi:LysM repeat protein
MRLFYIRVGPVDSSIDILFSGLLKSDIINADKVGGAMKHNRLFFLTIAIFASSFWAQAQNQSYTVRPGDTLYSIARSFSLSPDALMMENGIKDPTTLQIGQKLMLPQIEKEYTIHEVARGDTLYGIAREYEVAIDRLCSINGISKDSLLKIGMELKVPIVSKLPVLEAGKEDDNGHNDSVPPSSGDVTPPSDYTGVPLWPHAGSRKDLSGKLKGIEIQGNAGDDVVAVNSGNVVWVAPYRGYGRLVMVEGADDTIYAYGGNGETFVHVGDRVSPGTVLGKLGTHLIEKDAKVFFFVYKDGKPLDPAKAPRG